MRRGEGVRERRDGEEEKKHQSFFSLIPQQTLHWIMLISRSILLILSLCVCLGVCVVDTDTPATERQGNSSSHTQTFQSPSRLRDAFKQEQENEEEPRSPYRDEIKESSSEITTSALSLQQSSKNLNLSLNTNNTINSMDTPPKSMSFQEVLNRAALLSRRRRSWIWNQFFVIEEYSGPEPVLLGRVRDTPRLI